MRTTILSVMFSMLVAGQNEALTRREQAQINHERLKISIVPSRTTYLPGEEMEVTVRVVNPTSERLEVLRPFSKENGVLYLQEKGNAFARSIGEEFGDIDPHQNYGDFSGPLVTLKPGEIVERIFGQEYVDRSGDPILVAPSWPGDYRIAFSYGGFAPFKVAGPIEVWTYATHSRPVFVLDRGERIPVPSYVFAMVFRSGSEHVVCISMYDTSGGSPDLYVDASGLGSVGSVAPIRRVAMANGPVSDFRLQVLNNDNFRLTWRDSSGIRLLDLDKKRRILR